MTDLPWSSDEIETVSEAWEMATGADSIRTIRLKYDRSASGAVCCVWPSCSFKRRDAVEMWRHVHTHKEIRTISLPPADFDWSAYL